MQMGMRVQALLQLRGCLRILITLITCSSAWQLLKKKGTKLSNS